MWFPLVVNLVIIAVALSEANEALNEANEASYIQFSRLFVVSASTHRAFHYYVSHPHRSHTLNRSSVATLDCTLKVESKNISTWFPVFKLCTLPTLLKSAKLEVGWYVDT